MVSGLWSFYLSSLTATQKGAGAAQVDPEVVAKLDEVRKMKPGLLGRHGAQVPFKGAL